MLLALSIQNIVLIEHLDLEFSEGLSVLTGETGAGKSILLDSFGLALGARGDARLVRKGAPKGQVVAEFEVAPDHIVMSYLKELEIEPEERLVLRRIQSVDGRTRGFINDVPVGVKMLRRIGEALVEIHGQHDDRALMDQSTHQALLDAFGVLGSKLDAVRKSWAFQQQARKDLKQHRQEIENIRDRAGYLSHVLEELTALAAQEGEEDTLDARRQLMMSAEKVADDLKAAGIVLSGRGGITALSGVQRRLEGAVGAEQLVRPVIQAIERVLIEAGEAQNTVSEALRGCQYDESDQEQTELRLFALRETARKHKVPVASLVELHAKIEKELAALDADEKTLIALEETVKKAEIAYEKMAAELSKARKKVARQLDAKVNHELAPLRLEKARFITEVTSKDEGGPEGADRVVFHVQTNPGAEAGPLMIVASGGELSRFILALKVVLAARGAAPVLIFDEVDKGVGGATAAAIGERLLRLSQDVQVLAVTHAPQVAALAHGHLRISKSTTGKVGQETTTTTVERLPEGQRREEIARMLAGNQITDEARAAADKLMR